MADRKSGDKRAETSWSNLVEPTVAKIRRGESEEVIELNLLLS